MNTWPQVTIKPELPVGNCHHLIYQVKADVTETLHHQAVMTHAEQDSGWVVKHEQIAHIFGVSIPDALQLPPHTRPITIWRILQD